MIHFMEYESEIDPGEYDVFLDAARCIVAGESWEDDVGGIPDPRFVFAPEFVDWRMAAWREVAYLNSNT